MAAVATSDIMVPLRANWRWRLNFPLVSCHQSYAMLSILVPTICQSMPSACEHLAASDRPTPRSSAHQMKFACLASTSIFQSRRRNATIRLRLMMMTTHRRRRLLHLLHRRRHLTGQTSGLATVRSVPCRLQNSARQTRASCGQTESTNRRDTTRARVWRWLLASSHLDCMC